MHFSIVCSAGQVTELFLSRGLGLTELKEALMNRISFENTWPICINYATFA